MTILLVNRLRGMNVITDKGLQMGRLNDVIFDENSGRISMLVVNPTIKGILENLPKDKSENFLIPYSTVISISDHIVINEQEVLLLKGRSNGLKL